MMMRTVTVAPKPSQRLVQTSRKIWAKKFNEIVNGGLTTVDS
jgi:hypothetical protein